MAAPIVSPSTIQVSERQRGNPLLRFIRLCPWEYVKDVVPDYIMGSTCAIFVSLKYHLLHPKHAENRMREVGKMFRLRVLLTFADEENISSLLTLNRLCFSNEFTLIVANSNEECGRYIETLKNYENKSSASIQEKVETDFLPKLNKVLTSVKSVNKSDVHTLLDVFGSFANICSASEQQLVLCPGLGEKKVKRLHQALHQSFTKKRKHKQEVQQQQPSPMLQSSSSVDVDLSEPEAEAGAEVEVTEGDPYQSAAAVDLTDSTDTAAAVVN